MEISRVTRSKGEAKIFYDRISRWYDLLAGKSEKKYQDIGLKLLGIEPGNTVLEIGIGTGQAILSLGRVVGGTGKVVGLDISKGMLAVTEARVNAAGLTDRVALNYGDAVSLPFHAGIFDAIFLCFTLELFDSPEIPLVLRECHRVMTSQGRICLVSMSKKGKSNPMMVLYDWAHRHFPTVVDCRPIYAQKALETTAFNISESIILSMWGLPVEVVLARKSV